MLRAGRLVPWIIRCTREMARLTLQILTRQIRHTCRAPAGRAANSSSSGTKVPLVGVSAAARLNAMTARIRPPRSVTDRCVSRPAGRQGQERRQDQHSSTYTARRKAAVVVHCVIQAKCNRQRVEVSLAVIHMFGS